MSSQQMPHPSAQAQPQPFGPSAPQPVRLAIVSSPPDTLIFHAPIRFEAADAAKLRAEFDRLANAPCSVIVDLTRTEAIDGSGVGALAFVFKRLAAAGHTLTVRHASGQPFALLDATGLLQTLSPIARRPGLWAQLAAALSPARATQAVSRSARPAASAAYPDNVIVEHAPDTQRSPGAA